MAQRRMFSLKVIDTDTFNEMSVSARLLYFELAMRADDDGFVSSPKKILRSASCSEDDMKILIIKRFIIPFESGVCVIRDWRIHNYIQSDRYQETQYKNEKRQLETTENGEYKLINSECIQNVYKMDTQVRLELGKERKERERKVAVATTAQNLLDLVEEKKGEITEKYSSSGSSADQIESEIKKFLSYWCEKNKSGRERWQAEKFFDVGRRLGTWFSNIKKWDNTFTKEETKNINDEIIAFYKGLVASGKTHEEAKTLVAKKYNQT